jgi:hypothetical protein
MNYYLIAEPIEDIAISALFLALQRYFFLFLLSYSVVVL